MNFGITAAKYTAAFENLTGETFEDSQVFKLNKEATVDVIDYLDGEDNLDDMQKALKLQDKASSEIAIFVENTAELEAIVLENEKKILDGSATPQDVVNANEALATACALFGFDKPIVCGFEDIGNDTIKALKVANEGIGDTIAKGFTAVIDFFKKFFGGIWKFIKGLFGMGEQDTEAASKKVEQAKVIVEENKNEPIEPAKVNIEKTEIVTAVKGKNNEEAKKLIQDAHAEIKQNRDNEHNEKVANITNSSISRVEDMTIESLRICDVLLNTLKRHTIITSNDSNNVGMANLIKEAIKQAKDADSPSLFGEVCKSNISILKGISDSMCHLAKISDLTIEEASVEFEKSSHNYNKGFDYVENIAKHEAGYYGVGGKLDFLDGIKQEFDGKNVSCFSCLVVPVRNSQYNAGDAAKFKKITDFNFQVGFNMPITYVVTSGHEIKTVTKVAMFRKEIDINYNLLGTFEEFINYSWLNVNHSLANVDELIKESKSNNKKLKEIFNSAMLEAKSIVDKIELDLAPGKVKNNIVNSNHLLSSVKSMASALVNSSRIYADEKHLYTIASLLKELIEYKAKLGKFDAKK